MADNDDVEEQAFAEAFAGVETRRPDLEATLLASYISGKAPSAAS
jgi:hypothetical protein